ncbi:MAG: hypothetical protein ACK6CT_05540 [Planctomycetia bacterium]|jgi:hypothetical protein
MPAPGPGSTCRFYAAAAAAVLPLAAAPFAATTGCGAPPAPAAVAADPAAARVIGDRIDAALTFARERRRLNAAVHGAWQVVHGVLAFGQSFPLEYDGRVVPALDHLLGGGPIAGWKLRPGRPGVVAVVEEGSTMGQGHPDQWLGYLSQCGVAGGPRDRGGIPLDTRLVVAGRERSVADLLTQAKHDIRAGQEATWTLMALATYLPTNTTWTAGDGDSWSVERVVAMEAEAEIFSAACGGAHRLYALAVAVAARRTEGFASPADTADREDADGWTAARRVLDDCIDRARRFQHEDGTFSIHSFERPGATPDVGARLSATGHVFEVLAVALDEGRIREPWMTRAADRLTTLLEQTSDVAVECGGLYHACHGLAIYRRRISAPVPGATP